MDDNAVSACKKCGGEIFVFLQRPTLCITTTAYDPSSPAAIDEWKANRCLEPISFLKCRECGWSVTI